MAAMKRLLTKPVRSDLDEFAALLRLLAEPRRLHIIYLLMRREMCVCEILPELGISQPLSSHHLSVLAKAGLIQPRRDAQRIFYSIIPAQLARLKELFQEYLDVAQLCPAAAYGEGAASCPPSGSASVQGLDLAATV
jgi:ArsR family transcriptional regulator